MEVVEEENRDNEKISKKNEEIFSATIQKKKILDEPNFMYASTEMQMWKKNIEDEVLSPTRVKRINLFDLTESHDFREKNNNSILEKKSMTESVTNLNVCMICFISQSNCVLMNCGHGGYL